MEISEKDQFIDLLEIVLASYGAGLPAPGIMAAWWSNLQPYPLRVVRAAFDAYCGENGEFAPKPAGIAMRCKLMDGRPGAEEAWAIALTSQDERDTVVWTTEAAEAFAICRPVLESSGAISARKSFLEAYTRIVTAARAARRPAEWLASPGWDVERRVSALASAQRAGLMLAGPTAMLLAGPDRDQPADENARAQVKKVLSMLACNAQEKADKRDAELEADWRKAEDERRRIAEQVVRYGRPRENGNQGAGQRGAEK